MEKAIQCKVKINEGKMTNKVCKRHKLPDEFTCDTCNKKFAQRYRIVRHIMTHLEHREKFKCSFCPKELDTKQGRSRHEMIHSGVTPFMCEICGMKFHREDFLIRHKYEDHSLGLPYLCDFCGKAFRRFHYYARHKTLHTGEKRYECKICCKRFRLATTLSKHIKIHQMMKCAICSAMVRSKMELQRHEKIHFKKEYQCDQCEASFSQNCNLTKHKIIHQGLKPYKCHVKFCKCAYAHKSNLNAHIKRAHRHEVIVNNDN